MRSLADEKRVEAIDRRLIHGIERQLHVATELVRRYPAHMMFEPENARDLPGEWHFIFCCPLEFAKSKRDRGKRIRRPLARDGGKYARVYPGGKEDPDRRIGNEVAGDRAVHFLANQLVLGQVYRRRQRLRLRQDLRGVEITALLTLAVPVQDEHRACRQGADFAIQCVWFRDVTPDEKADVPSRLRGASHLWSAQQGLHHRRNPDRGVVIGVVERLDAAT